MGKIAGLMKAAAVATRERGEKAGGNVRRTTINPAQAEQLLEAVWAKYPEMEWHTNAVHKDKVGPDGKTGVVLGGLIDVKGETPIRRSIVIHASGAVNWTSLEPVAL